MSEIPRIEVRCGECDALLGSMWSHHPLPLIYCPACVKRMEEEQLEARHE